MFAPHRLALAAFAGLVISAALYNSASASESLTSIAPPAARLGDADGCRFLAPRFELKANKPPTEEARFLGGAKLRNPVAAPCPRPGHDVEV